MPVQHYSTGPVMLFVQFRQGQLNGQPAFLGWGETAPDIEERPEWEPVMSDDVGSKIPSDIIWQGSHAYVSVDMTKRDEEIILNLKARPYFLNSVPGLDVFGERGSLLITENLSFIFYCLFTYNGKPVYGQNGQPDGYRFPYTWVEGPDVHGVGMKVNKRHLVFHSIQGPQSKGNPFNHLVYDHDMSALAPFVPGLQVTSLAEFLAA